MQKYESYKPPIKVHGSTYAVNTAGKQISKEEYDALFKEAVDLYKLGVNGDKEAVGKSFEILKKLNAADTGNHLVEAYFGGVTSLMGRDAVNPVERFNKAVRGLKILDRAVSAEPENIEIRNLRAYVCYKLPEQFFHRTGTAVEDFKFIISKYEQDSSLLTAEQYWKMLFDLGTAYKTLNNLPESQAVWKKLLSVTTDPKYKNLTAQAGLNPGPEKETVREAPAEASLTEKDAYKEVEPVELPKPPVQNETKIMQALPLENHGKIKDTGKKRSIAEGIELHKRAFDGEEQALQNALQFFEKAHGQNPGDPLISAYYADCLSLMGRYSKNPSTMFENAIKAIKIFDSSVNCAPDNLEIRLLRGNQSYRLPEAFFRRTATAITDFEYLIQRYAKDSSVLSRGFYCNLLYLLGRSYQRLGMENESKSVWKKLLSLGDNAEFKTLLAEELSNTPIEENLPDSAASDDYEALLKEGIRLHDFAVKGDSDASKKACELLKKVYAAKPGDPVTEGYYGSSIALAGRDSMNSQTMFNNAIEGMKLLKHAVSRDGNNIKLRLLRAYLYFNLPDAFFHVIENASKDFKFLLNAHEKDNSVLSQEQLWQIIYDLGVCYERMNEREKAVKTWKKLLAKNPDQKYIELLKGKVERSDNQ